MNLFFLHRPEKREAGLKKRMKIAISERPHNTNEGSEFLDDAIRIIDQPLVYNPKHVTVECSEDKL